MTIKDNLRATSAPSATDDTSAGYSIGSTWYNKSTGTFWVCRVNTASAAEWMPIQSTYEAWQSASFRLPDNFGSILAAQQPAVEDRIYLLPFLITRAIDGVSLYLETVGSTDAAAVLGLYPNNPMTNKPDGQSRIGSNLGSVALTSGTGAKTMSFTARDITPGLYWLGVHLKGVTTMPIFTGMRSNGKHVHRADWNDIAAGTNVLCYSAVATYTGSAPSPCPVTSAYSLASPMAMIRTT
jgi:hypothetical protein